MASSKFHHLASMRAYLMHRKRIPHGTKKIMSCKVGAASACPRSWFDAPMDVKAG
jgi:hypothetical protein